MAEVRPATPGDLPRLTEIYNHYVINTAITFDIERFTIEQRRPWFASFSPKGRYRLLVVEEGGLVLGYAGSHSFRIKPAYDTTVETSIYCAPEATGRGLGTLLYGALFESIRNEDIHRLVAGITMPNDASVALHRRLGFREIGRFSENGRKFGRYWDVSWLERPLV